MKAVRFQAPADEELNQAYEWYDGQRLGLGPEFMSAIEQCLDRITQFPAA